MNSIKAMSEANQNQLQNGFDNKMKNRFEQLWNQALTKYGYNNVAYLKNIISEYNIPIGIDSVYQIIKIFYSKDCKTLIDYFLMKLNNLSGELQEKNFIQNIYNMFTNKSVDTIYKAFANDIYIEVRKFILNNVLYNVKYREEWQKYFSGKAKYFLEFLWSVALQKYGENNVSNLKSKLNIFKIESVKDIMKSVEHDNIKNGFNVIFNTFCSDVKLLGKKSYKKKEFRTLFYEKYDLLVNNLCNFIKETKYAGKFSGYPDIFVTDYNTIKNIWDNILLNNDKSYEDIITVLEKYKMDKYDILFDDFDHIMLHYKIAPPINEILHKFSLDINELNANDGKSSPAMYLEKYGLMLERFHKFKQQMKSDIVNFDIPAYYDDKFVQEMKKRGLIFENDEYFYNYDIQNVLFSKYNNVIKQACKNSNIKNIENKFGTILRDFVKNVEKLEFPKEHDKTKQKNNRHKLKKEFINIYDKFVNELLNFMKSEGYYIDNDKLSNPKYYMLSIIYDNNIQKMMDIINNICILLENNGIENSHRLLKFYNIISYYKEKK